jgi:hypothetical protein
MIKPTDVILSRAFVSRLNPIPFLPNFNNWRRLYKLIRRKNKLFFPEIRGDDQEVISIFSNAPSDTKTYPVSLNGFFGLI